MGLLIKLALIEFVVEAFGCQEAVVIALFYNLAIT